MSCIKYMFFICIITRIASGCSEQGNAEVVLCKKMNKGIDDYYLIYQGKEYPFSKKSGDGEFTVRFAINKEGEYKVFSNYNSGQEIISAYVTPGMSLVDFIELDYDEKPFLKREYR